MNKSIYILLVFLLASFVTKGQDVEIDTLTNSTSVEEVASLDTKLTFPTSTTLHLKDLPDHSNLQLLSHLQGRNSSLNIMNNSGSPGASISAILRGRNSFFNNYSPLIILDGLPIDNSEWNNDVGGTDQSNRLIDINPFDIESVQIIPGSVGSVLQGIRGANGVIVLTSKSGSQSKPRINIQSETTISKVGKLPKRQSTYAQGRTTPDGPEYRGPEFAEGFSWGPAIGTLEYFASPGYPYDKNGFLVPLGAGDGLPANAYDPYVFFQDAISQNLNASVMGGNRNFKYYLSGGRNVTNGVIPKTEYIRNTIFGSISSSFVKNLDIKVTARYIASNAYRNQKGSNIKGVMLGLLRNTPTFDITNGLSPSDAVNDPTSYTKSDGGQRSYRNGVYDSPYWTINNNPHNEDINRLITNLSLNYKINESFALYLNGGIDNFKDSREGGIEINPGRELGSAYLREREFNSNNLDGGVKISKAIASNLEADLTIGTNYFETKTIDNIADGNTLLSPGFVDIFNTQDVTLTTDDIRIKNFGALVALDLNYANAININIGARNDYSSTLGKNQKGFLSFGINSSFDLRELISINNKNITELQIFAGYGRTGQTAPALLTQSTFEPAIINSSGFVDFEEIPGFLERSEIGDNPNLKAEKTDAFEIGLKTSLFSDKIRFMATYYTEKTSDIIVLKDIAPSSGFNFIYDNAATVKNSGIELTLSVNLIRNNNFSWTLNTQFNTNKNTVEEVNLFNENNLFLTGFTSSSSRFIEGESYGSLWGTPFQRNENGQMIIGDDGFPLADGNQKVLGDPNPDFILGLDNQFKIGKKLSIGFLWDIKQGGDMYCGTCGIMNYFGVSQLSADERNTSVVFEGVTVNGTQNTQLVNLADSNTADNLFYRKRYGFGGILEMNIFDASWIRLRRFNVNYDFTSLVSKVPFVYNFSVGFYADNLLLLTDYPGIDPETSMTGNSNGFGQDYFNNPGIRSFGVNINLSL